MVVTISMDVSRGHSLLSMDVESTSTIMDVKRCIDHVQSAAGKRSPEYDLYFNGNLLEENLTLKDCGVESQSTLQLAKSLHLQIRVMERPSIITLSALSSDTIDTVKHRISQTEHLPDEPSYYCLCFLGNRLVDTATLSDCDVQDGSILQLIQEHSRLLELERQVAQVRQIMQSNIEMVMDQAESLSETEKRATALSLDQFSRGIKSHRRSTLRSCAHCILAVLCFPCVLINECYERRQHRNELQGYTELPGDVIKTTTTGILYVILVE